MQRQMNADNFGELFKDVLPSKLVPETACQVPQRDGRDGPVVPTRQELTERAPVLDMFK